MPFEDKISFQHFSITTCNAAAIGFLIKSRHKLPVMLRLTHFMSIVSSSMIFRGIQALCLAGIWAITDCVWTKRECPSERVDKLMENA
jgi:hypothetical protein